MRRVNFSSRPIDTTRFALETQRVYIRRGRDTLFIRVRTCAAVTARRDVLATTHRHRLRFVTRDGSSVNLSGKFYTGEVNSRGFHRYFFTR